LTDDIFSVDEPVDLSELQERLEGGIDDVRTTKLQELPPPPEECVKLDAAAKALEGKSRKRGI
jgi:hypothetical protein